MENSRQKLHDFEELFPGETLTIGKNSVSICPLNISQIAILSKKIKGIGSVLSEEGITWDNYSENASIFQIAVVLLNSFPEVLEEAANIDIADLKRLPLNEIVKIVSKVIEVNLKSKDDLTKNFKSLTEKLVRQIPMVDKEPKKKKNKK